jgi:hypothetical protein
MIRFFLGQCVKFNLFSYYFGFQEDLDAIDRLIDDAEAQFINFQHPDPYIGM